ncbi:unnamed protein product, partial [Brachionus calyciflorus]
MEILLGEWLIENKYNVKKKLKDTTEKVNQNLYYENRAVLDDEKINNLKQKGEIIGLKDGLKSLENVFEKNEFKKELDSFKVDVNSVKEDLNRKEQLIRLHITNANKEPKTDSEKPLVKNPKNSTSDLNNLRPVSVSDCIKNLYERIILNRIEKSHLDHEKQFGFKKKSSCQHATFVVKQAIKYFKQKNKLLYLCAIDASKAFDKVNREALRNKMKTKNIDPAII